MKPTKPVKAIRHKDTKRAHIPSAEEAGYEVGSAHIKEQAGEKHLPLNPIVHRGQDPELQWLDKYKQRDLRIPIRSLYGHTSRPFPVKKGQKMAVRVVSQFGEETTKVLTVG
jgi:hypothetical protein